MWGCRVQTIAGFFQNQWVSWDFFFPLFKSFTSYEERGMTHLFPNLRPTIKALFSSEHSYTSVMCKSPLYLRARGWREQFYRPWFLICELSWKTLGLFWKFPPKNKGEKKNQQAYNCTCILIKAFFFWSMILTTRLTLKNDKTKINLHTFSTCCVLHTGTINSATFRDKFHLTH